MTAPAPPAELLLIPWNRFLLGGRGCPSMPWSGTRQHTLGGLAVLPHAQVWVPPWTLCSIVVCEGLVGEGCLFILRLRDLQQCLTLQVTGEQWQMAGPW
jgi:hypothetical protein